VGADTGTIFEDKLVCKLHRDSGEDLETEVEGSETSARTRQQKGSCSRLQLEELLYFVADEMGLMDRC